MHCNGKQMLRPLGNFWTVRPIFNKFDKLHQSQSSNMAMIVLKNRRIRKKMAAYAIFYFYLLFIYILFLNKSEWLW